MKRMALGLSAVLVAGGVSASEPNSISANWRHIVKTDPVDDRITCMVMAGTAGDDFPPLLIYMSGMAGGSLGVVGDTYPGSSVVFRVDQNPPVSGKERVYGSGYSELFSQIASGGQYLTYKVVEWPSGAPVYMRVSLNGAKEHIAACVEAI